MNIYNFAQVDVGRMTVISQYCYLCTGTHNYRVAHMPLTYAPIAVGKECWLATGVYVSPGVTVADGAVVGAMSVVTKSLPDAWVVYAGNPCGPIKARVMEVQA